MTRGMQNDTWRKESGGSVARVSGWRNRTLNIVQPQRFVFHHVPKCGGTSVARALRKRCLLSQATVLPEASFRAYEAYAGTGRREEMLINVLGLREQMLLYLMFADTRCIAAHVAYSDIARERFGDRYKFVTILREPVARFLSHYAWSHGRSGAHAEISDPFDSFLDSPRAARMGASYIEYFGGAPKSSDLRSAEVIGRAVDCLRSFDVVGRLDDMPGFRAALKTELGLTVRIGHENRAGGDRPGLRATDLNAAQLAKVRDLCAPDLAVWEAMQ